MEASREQGNRLRGLLSEPALVSHEALCHASQQMFQSERAWKEGNRCSTHLSVPSILDLTPTPGKLANTPCPSVHTHARTSIQTLCYINATNFVHSQNREKVQRKMKTESLRAIHALKCAIIITSSRMNNKHGLVLVQV